MSDAITGINAVESIHTAKSSSFLQPVIDTVQQHENPSTIEQQTFKLVREQALASQAANAEHVRNRIRSKLKNIQVELSVKAAGKTSQGLQQLLSSQ